MNHLENVQQILSLLVAVTISRGALNFQFYFPQYIHKVYDSPCKPQNAGVNIFLDNQSHSRRLMKIYDSGWGMLTPLVYSVHDSQSLSSVSHFSAFPLRQCTIPWSALLLQDYRLSTIISTV